MKRLLVLALVLLTSDALAQEVIKHADQNAPLEQRWEWAQSACEDACWIGYGIQRMMHANSFTGWMSNGDRDLPTLQSLVYGREVEPRPTSDRRSDEMVMKEIGILLKMDKSGMREIEVSNISMPVDLEGIPLLWLGRADDPASIRVLQSEYARAKGTDLKEDLVSAIGMHESDDALPFLTKVLESNEAADVREKAVFWLSEVDDGSVLPILERTARRDRSEDVREQAVFGISRIETEEADELLIDLAKHLDDRETREKAIFWLGQKASEKAAAHLEEIVENDEDLEIQKKAVFAISQLPDDQGIPRLITIARTHRSAKVRHEAIFWLGESGDERAVDVLVELVRGG